MGPRRDEVEGDDGDMGQDGFHKGLARGTVKSYAASNAINEVAVVNGYALIAANDFASLNLADPNAAAFVAPDAGSTENSVAVLGTYAFTSTPNATDGRIRRPDLIPSQVSRLKPLKKLWTFSLACCKAYLN